jgi:tRNA(Arg) A34 adenosine deaminase TadA
MTAPSDVAADAWQELDEPWREAFRQAWDAFRTGNVPVGAVASTADGEIVRAARNRLTDTDGPPGEQERLAAMEVDAAFGSLWPRLRELPLA